MAKKKKHIPEPKVPYSDPRGRTRQSKPAPKQPKSAAPEVDAAEYEYVARDMRRIAILALVIFGAQVVLKFWMG